jgi:hypothetical protein
MATNNSGEESAVLSLDKPRHRFFRKVSAAK